MPKDKTAQMQDELVGLLMAISIVSRRLAENLKRAQPGKEATSYEKRAKYDF